MVNSGLMRLGLVTFFALGLICRLSNAEEVFQVANLSHDSVEVRDLTQKKMIKWASLNSRLAKERFLKLYVKSKDPELRRRLIPVLEHAYFPPKGYLGVQMISAKYDRLGKLLAPEKQRSGVVVARVVEGSPAAMNGLQVGDLILRINGQEFEGEDRVSDAAKEIQRNSPKTPVILTIERDGKTLNIQQKLGFLPVPSERARMQRAMSEPGEVMISPEIREQLEEFRGWLWLEIEKERKNLIAERRS